MANRTFKVYGQAYAASGDVTVTITVDGNQVFNGAVADSTTPITYPPTSQSEMLSFTMDESVIGDKSLSINVSGGEFVMGNWQCNGAHNEVLPKGWIDVNAPDQTNISAEAQGLFADAIGSDALGADLYNALKAGTLTNPTAEQITAMNTANDSGPLNLTDYVWLTQENDKRLSAQINGEALPDWDNAQTSATNWVVLQDGDEFTATWSITPKDNWPDNEVL